MSNFEQPGLGSARALQESVAQIVKILKRWDTLRLAAEIKVGVKPNLNVKAPAYAEVSEGYHPKRKNK